MVIQLMGDATLTGTRMPSRSSVKGCIQKAFSCLRVSALDVMETKGCLQVDTRCCFPPQMAQAQSELEKAIACMKCNDRTFTKLEYVRQYRQHQHLSAKGWWKRKGNGGNREEDTYVHTYFGRQNLELELFPL